MKRWKSWYGVLGTTLLGIAACDGKLFEGPAKGKPAAQEPARAAVTASSAALCPPLYAGAAPAPVAPAYPPRRPGAADPIIVRDCHLGVIEKQDVPSQHDGVLLFIGTPLQDGEQVSADRILVLRAGAEEKKFRRLQDGDTVRAGQLLAQLDDRLARDDWLIKDAKVTAAKADLASTEKSRDDAERRYKVRTSQNSSQEEISSAKLAWDHYAYEAVSKREAIVLAELERNEAQTVLEMHQIRSTIPGVIKTIHKKPGEAVKNLEPVLQLYNLARLQAEGLVDVQDASRLHQGMRVLLEPAQAKGPEQTLIGHMQDVTAVAVSKDLDNPAVVSASEDGTVRVWDRLTRRERRILHHPAAVRAVACAPAGAPANGCLSGAADGVARLWDLDGNSKAPLREFKAHNGAVTCVAFSPDGKLCATGGDDCEICLWDLSSGVLRYRLPVEHRGAVTSLQFTPQSRLVSAGSDNTLRLWSLGQKGGHLEATLDRRSGDVTHLGVSRDGQRVLFDQGKVLRLLSLPDGLTEGVLQNPSGAANFTTFALFSPDAQLVLTAGVSEGRLQVWRAPGDTSRGYELCQLVPPEHATATCAAFAPDGSFMVTGTRDRQVLVWSVPGKEEVERQLSAEITLAERSVESTAGQVRVRAELANPDGRLLPGTAVNMVIYPGP